MLNTKRLNQVKDEIENLDDGVLRKKIRGRAFIIERYFDKKSKDTFRDTLLRVEKNEKNKKVDNFCIYLFRPFSILFDERIGSEQKI